MRLLAVCLFAMMSAVVTLRPAAALDATPVVMTPAPLPKADLVFVDKSERRMDLFSAGQIIRTYRIALGFNPIGHKQYEGDGRTPEGVYILDFRNEHSGFYRSIRVNYPRIEDRESAARRGVRPGGQIMIHGLPNERSASSVAHPRNDWTDGCIAVTNEEMAEIWQMVDSGTAIIIQP